jgi:peptidoglycan/LPS O-acetylase OafA/YrhL
LTFILIIALIGAELVKFNHSLLLSILFALLILCLVIQKIEIKFLKYFGKISYGIYMLHPFFLFISFSIAANFKNVIVFNFVFYLLSFALTIGFSALSFKYFESPILKLKKRHTIIDSGT